MLSRHDISDAHWDRIENLLSGRPGEHGGVGKDNRLFLDAVRYLAKTGIAWAELPACYGKPNSPWQRYNRWCARGVWQKLAAESRDGDTEWLSVNSTCARGASRRPGREKSGRHRRAVGRGALAGAGAASAPISTPR